MQAQPYVKRQQEYISEDVWRCCNPDIQTPFRNLQDALDRLLPYHVRHFPATLCNSHCCTHLKALLRAAQTHAQSDMAVQVFHTEDGGEAEKDTCKADDGTPISQQEAAKQQTLGKAAALLDKACPAILPTPSSDLPWSCHIAGLPQLKGFSGAAHVCLTSCADAKAGESDSSRGG